VFLPRFLQYLRIPRRAREFSPLPDRVLAWPHQRPILAKTRALCFTGAFGLTTSLGSDPGSNRFAESERIRVGWGQVATGGVAWASGRIVRVGQRGATLGVVSDEVPTLPHKMTGGRWAGTFVATGCSLRRVSRLASVKDNLHLNDSRPNSGCYHPTVAPVKLLRPQRTIRNKAIRR